MKMKKIVAVLLVVVMAFSCVGATAFADDNDIVVLADEYRTRAEISADGYEVEMITKCRVFPEIKELQMEVTLEKFWGLFIWTTQIEPTSRYYFNTGKEKNCEWKRTALLSEAGTYRIKAVFHLTKTNGQKQSFTKYSNEVIVPN
ncbi:MAG TPA: hypothetical protein DER68_02190 [Ruminococcaceae bacterium]|nr:hypothetical protein [Oscillospiraceae bacterium]